MTVDLAIVGAGPAGLGAAAEAARLGMSVVVVDEFHRPGGRLLGQLHEDPRSGEWFNGLDQASALVDEATRAGASIVAGVQVWAARPDPNQEGQWQVHLTSDKPEVQAQITARAVVLATGAAERPIPIPGWTLPGVMSIGAAQIFANLHRVKPGNRALVIGVNVLSLTIARELKLAGVNVVALVLPPAGPLAGDLASPRKMVAQMSELARLAPNSWQRAGGWLGRTGLGKALGPKLYPKEGLKSWGIPIQLRRAAVKILGEDSVRAAVVTDIDVDGHPTGSPRELAVDLVCIAGGLSPLAELASAAGCDMAFVPQLGGQVPVLNANLETTCPNFYVAGNAGGVEGAQVALAYGRLVGCLVASKLGRLDADAGSLIDSKRSAVVEARNDAPIRFNPEIETGRSRVEELARH